MEYYRLEEVSEVLGISIDALRYRMRKIERETPHRFGKMFLGNYSRGKRKKQLVVSERDLVLLKNTLELEAAHEMTVSRAVETIFSPTI